MVAPPAACVCASDCSSREAGLPMVGILVLVKVNPERILVHQWHWYSSTAWYSYMFYTMRNMHKEHHALQSHFLIISCFFRQICCYPSCNALQGAFKVLFQSKKSQLDIQTLTPLYLGDSALCRPNSARSYLCITWTNHVD